MLWVKEKNQSECRLDNKILAHFASLFGQWPMTNANLNPEPQ